MNKKRFGWIENVIIVVCVLTISASFIAIGAIHSGQREKQEFRIEEHEEEWIYSIDGESTSLRKIGYYILVMETNYSMVSYEYDEGNADHFWNLWTGEGYFRQLAKEQIIEAAVRDAIYCREAQKEGILLTEEELLVIEEMARDEINKMNSYQRSIFAYDLEDMIEIRTRIKYAEKYVTKRMQEGVSREQLEVGGDEYQHIEEAYKVEINKTLWNQVNIGTLTTGAASE